MSSVTDIHPAVHAPHRYHLDWDEPFKSGISARLADGMTLLDVGSGRKPSLSSAERPPGTTYVGLDVCGDELRLAGEGAYDEVHVADIATPIPDLVGIVDLAVSWQVFEHVKPLEKALDNLHSYLKPAGTLISMFSGRWSAFGIVNRLIPSAVGTRVVERTMRRRGTDQPVFPAYYDGCSERALRRTTEHWDEVTITPLFRGANYFHFSRTLTRAYLAYESAVARAGLGNLATHYLLVATR